MDYSKILFNKELENLVYQDLTNFFSVERKESDIIEFKSYSATHGDFDRKFEAIIQTVCGLLNSNGGIVIWGAPAGIKSPNNKSKIFKGQLSPVSEFKEKDWLINKLSDSILPLPIGINVKILQNSNEYLYVFEIQQSNYRPHQYRNIYYIRLDGQTRPAPHYLIEALFKQVKFPNLEGYITIDNIIKKEKYYFVRISILLFNFSELQNEENVTFRVYCPYGKFLDSTRASLVCSYEKNGTELIYNNFMNILSFGTPGSHAEAISVDIDNLANDRENRLEIFLFFGGKKSPIKVSEYVIDFNKLDWSKCDDLNYLFEKIDENKLMSDRHNKRGRTKEDMLKNILGR